MKRFFTLSQPSILASLFLSSCLGSKFLKENEQLLARHEIVGVSGVLRDEVAGLVEQEPNAKPLGVLEKPIGFSVPFSHLVHIYKLGENGAFFCKGYDEERVTAKKDSLEAKFKRKITATEKEKEKQKLIKKMVKKLEKKARKIKEGNQLMHWGEPLAVYDSNKVISTSKNMKRYLDSKGYFNSEVNVDTTTVNKKKRHLLVSYQINAGAHFYIESIEYHFEDTVLQGLVFENTDGAFLKKGYYDQDMLTNERDYIYDLAVNNGYFEFSKQFVSFEIDSTTLGKDTLLIREVIRNPVGKDHHKIYYLDSIVFVSDASITQAYRRTTETHKDITFSFGKNRYSKKILQWKIPLAQDDRYSRDLTIETQRQLSYLDNFKFVNINYDTTGRKFVANIFTSPFDKYQTSSEFGFVQNNTMSNRLSPFFNIGLKNRNSFRALEIINIDINARLEGINDVTGEINTNYSSRQYGADLSFNFPQFLFPLGRFYKKKMGLFNPKTQLSIGIGFEDRTNEYLRKSVRTSLSYSWQVQDKIKHILTPVQLRLIDSDNTESFNEFLQDLEANGNTYALAFRSAYVNSSSYQLDYTQGKYSAGQHGRFYHLFVESGGNLNNIFGNGVFGDDIERYQFFKGNIDLRKIQKVTRKLNIAYRVNIGVALPYGDNHSLPYEKYFFGGGSSSLRAWGPRRLGPGAFGIPLSTDSPATDQNIGRWNKIDLTREQPGELFIESSFEFRQKLVGFLEGSLFFDAGNIWLINGNTVNSELDPEGDDGKFRWRDFINEMALGTGVGFRFDLSFLILRLDLGLKLIDPAQLKRRRFVGDEIFRNFRPNSELNIGIGYPF